MTDKRRGPEINSGRSLVRLQKIISNAGIASRRKAERFILEGRVSVNRVTIRELGAKANPLTDNIEVDGKKIKRLSQKVYILLNKPRGCVTTVRDDRGRPTVIDVLKGIKTNVYPVGRLDFNTEGILLLTNDGDFAHLLAHPRHKISKVYVVKVKGIPTEKELEKISSNIVIDKKKIAPSGVSLERITGKNSWLKITLQEGQKRQVRKMCEFIRHPVIKLKRIKYAFLELKGLKPGEYRGLTDNEVKKLMKMAER